MVIILHYSCQWNKRRNWLIILRSECILISYVHASITRLIRIAAFTVSGRDSTVLAPVPCPRYIYSLPVVSFLPAEATWRPIRRYRAGFSRYNRDTTRSVLHRYVQCAGTRRSRCDCRGKASRI